jgi:predicted MFS family arabinose efflux permease
MIPAAIAWIPESSDFIPHGPIGGQLKHRILVAFRRQERVRVAAGENVKPVELRAIARRPTILSAAMICVAVFLVQFSFYFLVSWTPTLLSDMGLAVAAGISGAMFMNLGGIAGDFGFALFCIRWGPRPLGALAMIACFCSVVLLSRSGENAELIMLCALSIGGFLFASMASLYTIAPDVFPSEARSTGTGLALSVGRIGGALGPWVGGIIIGHEGHLRNASLIFLAAPLLAAAAIVSLLRPSAAAHSVEGGEIAAA